MKKLKMVWRLLTSKNSILITSDDITTETVSVKYDINTVSNNLFQHKRLLLGVHRHIKKHFNSDE